MSILIQQVYLPDREGLWDILTEGSFIKRIDRHLNLDGVQVIDGKGCAALPGLVNAHTHAAMTLLRGYADDMPLMSWLEHKIWPAEAKLTPGGVYWGTMLAALEMVKSGTTCFADMYMHVDSMAQAVADSGLRAALGGALFKTEHLDEQQKVVHKWHGAENGRIQIMFAPHSLYACDPQLLRTTVKTASRLNVGLHIHLAESKDEEEIILSRYGKRPVAYAEDLGFLTNPLLAAHMVQVNEEDMALMQPYQQHISIAHNPHSNMKLSNGAAPVQCFLEKGFRVAIGTDGPSSNNSLDMFSETKSASLLAKLQSGQATAVPAAQALQMATQNGAQACLFANAGQLKEGYKADIILLDLQKPKLWPCHDILSQAVYAANGADVKSTIVDGCLLMKDYQILLMDEEKIMAEAARAARVMVI